MGEFFDRHPGPERLARADLTNELKKQLCETDPLLWPCDFLRVELDHAGRARAFLAAAVQGRAPDALAFRIFSVFPLSLSFLPLLFALLSSHFLFRYFYFFLSFFLSFFFWERRSTEKPPICFLQF